MRKIILLPLLLLLVACYNAERNCKDFKTGTFRTEILIDGVKKYTVSTRTENLVVETYEGRTDTASIRWINDCEYVLKQLHAKNMQEQKAVDIKILTTSKNSYTFEFGVVGDGHKLRGKAEKIN